MQNEARKIEIKLGGFSNSWPSLKIENGNCRRLLIRGWPLAFAEVTPSGPVVEVTAISRARPFECTWPFVMKGGLIYLKRLEAGMGSLAPSFELRRE
jgi:hypothetical protein